MRRSHVLSTTLAIFLTSACAHKQPVAEVSATAPVRRGTEVPAVASVQRCTQDDDCDAKALCIRSQCVMLTPEVELLECSLVRVHFDFNSDILRPDDNPGLVRIARCLRADQKLHVTIEGNADERGTEEYNLALGDKRATTVERYLRTLGVAAQQLKTVSYGFENPLCSEHDEACWSQNRRAGVKAQKPAGR